MNNAPIIKDTELESDEGIHCREAISTLFHTPLFFFGVAFYRVWIEIGYVDPYIGLYLDPSLSRYIFDISAALALFLSAFFHRRLTPLFQRNSLYIITAFLFVFSTSGRFLSLFLTNYSQIFSILVIICAGLSVSLLILLWAQFYSRISPYKVVYYYSGSLLLSSLLIPYFRGLASIQLSLTAIIIPLVSIYCAWKSISTIKNTIPEHSSYDSFSFPWKPVTLMAIYAFASGLVESGLYQDSAFGPLSSPGTMVASLIIFTGVAFKGRYFNLNVIWRIAMPVMICAFLCIPLIPDNAVTSTFFAPLSYTSFSIVTMLISASLCYRYSISPIWLFGIERGTRYSAGILGRLLSSAHIFPEYVTIILMVLGIVLTTLFLYSEDMVTSSWGIVPAKSTLVPRASLPQAFSLDDRCRAIATAKNLSEREYEVLFLLAKNLSISQVAEELFVANGTIKAHVRHIYKKLDIHSREELHTAVKNAEI